MDSNFAECLSFSETPWPDLRIAGGIPALRRASPGISGRHEVDFASINFDGRSYPEHDPFVGRIADLRKMSKLPQQVSDKELQQRFWVSGAGGIGKSALLRQHACHVCDLAFSDEDEPVWLLHAYCLNCIPARDAIAAYEEIPARFGLRTEPVFVEKTAKSLVNQGVALGKIDRHEEAILIFDQVVLLFGHRNEEILAMEVSKALRNRDSHFTGWEISKAPFSRTIKWSRASVRGLSAP